MTNKKNAKSIIKIIFIIMLLLIQILIFAFVVFYPQIRPFLRKMSTEYQLCCKQISEDFTVADSNHLFEITDAYLQGEYTYEISVDTTTLSSKQDYFDEIVRFIQKITDSICQKKDSKLYHAGYCFSFKGEILNSDFYITVWGKMEAEKSNYLYFQTNVFADYGTLNDLSADDRDITLELNTKFFKESEKTFIDQQKGNFLFDLVWID